MSYKLGQILTLQRGTTYKSKLLSKDCTGIPLLGLGCIARNGGFSHNGMKYYTGESPDKITLSSGDLLVSLKDLTQSCDLLGAVARIPRDITKGRLTQDTVGLIFNDDIKSDIIKKYVYWSLRTPQYRKYCKNRGTGTTNMALSRDDFLSWTIPDQNPIIDNIIQLLENIENKIELNNKINDNLQQQAQALFKAWFIDFEPWGGVMPEGWREAVLTDIAEYTNGLAMQKFRPNDASDSIPVLKIRELNQGFCDTNSDECSRMKIGTKFHIRDGDVIFSWSGTLLVDIWTGGTCGLNQHLFKVTSDKYDKWFYYKWTQYHLDKFIHLAKSMSTTMGHIKRNELEKSYVLIPTNEDMMKITSKMKPILDKIISARLENAKLAELRDTLLPKLMSGELDVSDIELSEVSDA